MQQISYLFINPANSTFISDLKIRDILRYVILNGDGNVLDRRASGPDSEILDDIFTRLPGVE